MRRNKFNAKKTLVGGIVFDSMAEADRYKNLKLLERAGELCDLKLQVPFEFILHNKKIFTYYADFTYADRVNGCVIEDVKSKITRKIAVYRLKKKLIEAQYGITITEYPAKKK